MRNVAVLRSCVVLGLSVLLGACATSRSEIKLSAPVVAASGAASATGPTIQIRTVKDERVFESAPKEPSTPSLGFEGAAQASAETKSRAIARKRNTYGRALGDVLLESGQTVEGVVRENLAAALRQAGYRVHGEGDGGAAALTLDVSIKKFWAWFQPGFWALKLHADVATDLKFSEGAAPSTIAVHAEESMQMATDASWMQIVTKALDAYRAQVVGKANTFPGAAKP